MIDVYIFVVHMMVYLKLVLGRRRSVRAMSWCILSKYVCHYIRNNEYLTRVPPEIVVV